MKVLVACEESQAVTIELRKRGHEAYSCDIQECSGGHPEWHINQDVIPLVNGNCTFKTADKVEHSIEGKWDLLVAHPPCTYLTVTGNRWFNVERYGEKAIQRAKDRKEAVEFFMVFANADCDHICIENPVGIMSTRWRKADQIIQIPTNVVTPPPRKEFASGNTMPAWYADAWHLPKEERSRLRSKTFPGIAEAIADQFTKQITEQNDLRSKEAI